MRLRLRRIPLAVAVLLVAVAAIAQDASTLTFCIRSDPKTFNPLQVADDASETVRYLTAGVLMRLNRQTQALEPGLATQWQVSKDARTISFTLRHGVSFSDGSPFSSADVAYTIEQMMDPAQHSPVGDSFRSGEGAVQTKVDGPDRITVTFPAPVASLDKQFDQVGILSSKSPHKEMAVLGPFYVADQKAGAYVLLKRNPNYWKHDGAKQLPYLDEIRLDIQSNRDVELARFRRGEIQMINGLDAELYDRLATNSPGSVRDSGPSLDSEQMWFNMVPTAPIPDYKRSWFASQDFRRAISDAINRDDMAKVAFLQHARAAYGPVSPSNKFWFDAKLPAPKYDKQSALAHLQKAGFRLDNGVLHDSQGHPVEFSIVTNSGNKYRERMATMIQQDLAAVGIKINVVTLDFPSLIERFTQSFNYEAAILGFTNVDLDPSSEMAVWLSSGENHAWYPNQKTPATAWEAEIDRLMREQASSPDPQQRKRAFDRVQEVLYEQAPMLFLVNKNALSAVSPAVANVVPVVLRPQIYWNADRLSLHASMAKESK